MRAINNTHIIDYLWINGVKPTYELCGVAYYDTNRQLRNLLDRYYIEFTCIPNKGWK